MARPKKNTRKTTEREVPVGQSFVAEGGKVHGTPSVGGNRNRSYAASSVIERGTVNKLRGEVVGQDEHFCACGCGQKPSQADSLFMPGHDSKVRAMGKAVLDGRIKVSELPKIAREYLQEGGMIPA